MYIIIIQGKLTTFIHSREIINSNIKFQSVYIWNITLQNININLSFPTFKHLLQRFLLNDNTSGRYDKYDLIPILYII